MFRRVHRWWSLRGLNDRERLITEVIDRFADANGFELDARDYTLMGFFMDSEGVSAADAFARTDPLSDDLPVNEDIEVLD